MAKIMLDVPDGETCEGCELVSCPFIWGSGIPANGRALACLAARVKPIVLSGRVRSRYHTKRKEWGFGYDLWINEREILFNPWAASETLAKRAAKRWVDKNLPGAIIEWES